MNTTTTKVGLDTCRECFAARVTIRCRAGCGRYLQTRCLCTAPPPAKRYCPQCMPARVQREAEPLPPRKSVA